MSLLQAAGLGIYFDAQSISSLFLTMCIFNIIIREIISEADVSTCMEWKDSVELKNAI